MRSPCYWCDLAQGTIGVIARRSPGPYLPSWCPTSPLTAREKGLDSSFRGAGPFRCQLGQTHKVAMGGLDGCKIGRRLTNRTASPERSLPCPRATKVVHGASARDIEEPALLGGGLRTAGVGDRHKSVLEPGHEHDPPLESLCSVEGHDVDGVADLSGRIGAQARLEPGDEPGRAGARVIAQVVSRQSAQFGEINIEQRGVGEIISA